MEGEEEKEVETHGDSNVEIYNTICKTDNQWKFAIWLKQLKQGLCDNLERWNGEGDRREFWEGGDMGEPMVDSCWCYNRKLQNPVKQLSFNLKNLKKNKQKALAHLNKTKIMWEKRQPFLTETSLVTQIDYPLQEGKLTAMHSLSMG